MAEIFQDENAVGTTAAEDDYLTDSEGQVA